MVDGAGGLDQFFGPGDRLVILDLKTEGPGVGGDGGGHVEVAMVGGPPKRGARIGQLDGEPGVGLALSGTSHRARTSASRAAKWHDAPSGPRWPHQRRRVAPRRTGGWSPASRTGSARRPVGDQQRLAHQRIQQIQDSEVVEVIESCHGAGALEVESAREHRTAIQQRLLRIIEQVVGPRHRVAQGVVAFQPAPDRQPTGRNR